MISIMGTTERLFLHKGSEGSLVWDRDNLVSSGVTSSNLLFVRNPRGLVRHPGDDDICYGREVVHVELPIGVWCVEIQILIQASNMIKCFMCGFVG